MTNKLITHPNPASTAIAFLLFGAVVKYDYQQIKDVQNRSKATAVMSHEIVNS